MNDQSQMMNNPPIPPPQVMNNPHHPQLMMNQPPPLTQPPQPNPQIMAQSQQFMINQSQQQQRSYNNRMWPPHQTSMDMMKFPNPNPNLMMKLQQQQGGFVGSKPRNWKGGKKGNSNDKRRKEKPVIIAGGSGSGSGLVGGGGGGGGGGGYKPPTLNELQHQNRIRARKFYPNKKKYSGGGTNNNRFAPYAPRNTTSFIIRAKKSGGIASLVSPCPVTPAVLPTPIFSPSREVLGDMAKEEWGVDGYGSMKGLIRLRNEADGHEDDEEEEVGSSESDVEEHVEVERRLDHDLSRFEMIYPNYGVDYNNVLENRVDDQDSHIAQLEDENLILKERLFLMEREFDDLRRRLQYLERQKQGVDGVNEFVENVSDNESEGNNDEVVEENNEEGGEVDAKEEEHYTEGQENNGCVRDVCMEESANAKQEVIDVNMSKDGGVGIHGNKSVGMEEFVVADKEVIGENQFKGEGVGIHGYDSVCMEEVADAQGEVAAEEQPKDDGARNGSSEKSIGDGDVFNRPVLLVLDGGFILLRPEIDYKSSFLEQSKSSGCSRRLERHRCLISSCKLEVSNLEICFCYGIKRSQVANAVTTLPFNLYQKKSSGSTLVRKGPRNMATVGFNKNHESCWFLVEGMNQMLCLDSVLVEEVYTTVNGMLIIPCSSESEVGDSLCWIPFYVPGRLSNEIMEQGTNSCQYSFIGSMA
ncbi:hypothetical protein RHGRI_038145 [Rhododendron griersonianum]|uniref:PRLI-interacting factor A n=1 Tax=Rhododendron griersonianum TaxID=479676 RepID=A0AAV6HXC8_9ERIC|nr:hypothetical protein RHGRI_038145 [Rhododendron griersonianum]